MSRYKVYYLSEFLRVSSTIILGVLFTLHHTKKLMLILIIPATISANLLTSFISPESNFSVI